MVITRKSPIHGTLAARAPFTLALTLAQASRVNK